MMAHKGNKLATGPLTSTTDILESAVLEVLLEHHPAQLSLDEIAREVARDPDNGAGHDEVTNAVRDLSRAGLVHRHDRFVFASRAAVRSQELCI